MTTKNLRRSAAVLSTAALLAFGLSACGGDSDVEAFCNVGSDLDNSMDDVDTSDLGASADAIDDALDEITSVDAPEEIASDVDLVVDQLGQAADIFRDLDGADPASDEYAASAEKMSDLMGTDFTEATTNIDTFVTDNCKA